MAPALEAPMPPGTPNRSAPGTPRALQDQELSGIFDKRMEHEQHHSMPAPEDSDLSGTFNVPGQMPPPPSMLPPAKAAPAPPSDIRSVTSARSQSTADFGGRSSRKTAGGSSPRGGGRPGGHPAMYGNNNANMSQLARIGHQIPPPSTPLGLPSFSAPQMQGYGAMVPANAASPPNQQAFSPLGSAAPMRPPLPKIPSLMHGQQTLNVAAEVPAPPTEDPDEFVKRVKAVYLEKVQQNHERMQLNDNLAKTGPPVEEKFEKYFWYLARCDGKNLHYNPKKLKKPYQNQPKCRKNAVQI